MTKVSRIKIEPKHFGFFLNNFWNLITLLEDKEQVKNFFKDLLTPTEMKMLTKRIQIAKMLIEGYDYRAIRNYVKVTDTTIAKISNILATSNEGLIKAVGYLQKIEVRIDKERMQSTPDLKKKHPIYYLPENIAETIAKKLKNRRKKESVTKDILL